MATVPSVPTFNAGSVATAVTLNQLGSAVSFLLAPPKAILQQTNASPYAGGQSISATTPTAIGFNSEILDSDNGWTSGNPTKYYAQTPGYFLVEGVWQSTAETTSGYRGVYFRITTGSNNPGGSGNTSSYGSQRTPNVTSSSGANYSAVDGAILLPYMYVNDYVEMIAYSSHAETTGFTDGGCMMSITLVSI